MPWFSSTFLGITGTTTLTCQRSQVGVLSRPSPECSNACLIAPTGRTRRDPDHRVTDLRRGVAESLAFPGTDEDIRPTKHLAPLGRSRGGFSMEFPSTQDREPLTN